jgi:hypothetical protein
MRALFLLGFLASATLATAQLPSQPVAPDGMIRTHIEGIDVPPVANAPFTAKIVVTWDQPLIGGGTVSHTYYTLVARDSQGRVRRETRDFVPLNSAAEPRLRSFSVTDPTDNSRITCSVVGMACTVANFHPPVPLASAARTPYTNRTGTVGYENLGQQTMQALPVVGTRETTSTTTRNQLVVSRKDLWYSPDLQMDLSVVRSDPQFGQVTLTVTDLVRQEPDPNWLAVPSGYQIADVRINQSVAK